MSEGSDRLDASGSDIAQATDGSTAIVDRSQTHHHFGTPIQPSKVTQEQLTAAQARLAELPVDRVPEVAPLPTGSHMPWPVNPTFVGREQDLLKLAAILKGGATAAIGQVAAATGLGGIGKTQLASAFVHAYGQYFLGGVHWLSLADAASVPSEVARCGLAMVPDVGFGQLPIEEQMRLVQQAWQSPLPRLLVFDNCEDEALLKAWRPSSGGARILVTARRQQWSRALGIELHPLGVLARTESLALLCRHRPDQAPDDPVLDAIAECLGDLPLALHLAGSFLERYQFDEIGRPEAYLEELRQPYFLEHVSLIEGETSPTDHEQHVGRTFTLSYGRLDQRDQADGLALDVLARASCFAPGLPIPRALLQASVSDGKPADAKAFADVLGRLLSLGLLQQETDGSLVLHRLLALFLQNEVGDLDAARAAVEEVVADEASRLNEEGYPALLHAWQGHLRFVAQAAAAQGRERAARLLNELGYHLLMIADLAGAEAAHRHALAIDEQRFGPYHGKVARDLNNLGMVLQDRGDLAAAKAAYGRALGIVKKVFGPNDPNLATIVSNLGGILYEQGDVAGAREAIMRALKIDEASFGPNHPAVAIRLNNLGNVLRDAHDMHGARAAFERALKIDEASFGPDHPKVARAINNLGLVHLAQGDLDGAGVAFERALTIDEKAFGTDHPNVAMELGNLGMVRLVLGDLAGAKAAFGRALSIFQTMLGPKHPNTQKVRALLDALGDGSNER